MHASEAGALRRAIHRFHPPCGTAVATTSTHGLAPRDAFVEVRTTCAADDGGGRT